LAMVLTIFIGMFFFGEPPFSTSQLLWINMIMDSLSAIALATEPPMASSVKGDPHNQTSLLKQPHIWRQIIGTALYMTGIMVLLFVFGGIACGSPVYHPYADLQRARTAPTDAGVLCPTYPAGFNEVTGEYFVGYGIAQTSNEACNRYIGANAKLTVLTYAFNTFCFMNLFNLINCRKIGAADKNIFERFLHNWTFIGVLFGGFVAHIFLVQCFPLLLRTSSAGSRGEWGGAIAVGASVLGIGLALKLTPQKWVEMLPVDRFGVDEDTGVPKGSMADRVLEAKRQSGMEGEVDIAAITEQVRRNTGKKSADDAAAVNSIDADENDPEADNDDYGRRYN